MKGVAEAVHGHQTKLSAIRVTDLAAVRTTRTVKYPGVVNPSTPVGDQSDYATNAAGLELLSGDVYSVRCWIRGVWDEAVKTGGVWTPPGPYIPIVNAYLAELFKVSNNFRLQVLNKTNPTKPVQGVTIGGVVTSPAHGFTAGARIRISGTKGVAGLNKTWRVLSVTTDTFTIGPWLIPAVAPVITQYGTARLLELTLVPITYASVIRASKRDVGRPFGLLSGRRRRRTT